MRLLCTLLVSCVFCIPAGLAEEIRPNVVVLFTDDQGTLDANCFGSTDLATPNIDRLAATGVRFTQAYAHKVCCPSRAALLTGRHPQRGGVTSWTQGDRHGTDAAKLNMATTEVTLAEVLGDAGYQTALFGKWHLGAKRGHGPLDQGFQTFFGHLGGFIDNYRHCFLHGKGFHDLYDGKQEVFFPDQYYPDLMIERAVKYIEAERDAPFFVTIAFNLPHYPEQPIDEFAEAYADLPMPRRSYARVVSSVDQHIGRVMNTLEEKGVLENTIVIFMSDNGHSAEDVRAGIRVDDHVSGYPKGHYYSAHGGGGNTGKWIGHKGQFLEGGIRVPAILTYPSKLPKGVVRDQTITVMDWFPTILELVGIERDDLKLDGKSTLAVIRDEDAASSHDALHFGWQNGWCVRRGPWKLIGQIGKDGRVTRTLHNLAEPKPETADYSDSRTDLVQQLTELHEAWAADVTPKDRSQR